MKTTGTNTANVQAREKLLDALIELLADKPVSAIPVAELTKKADVSRMTFYRNYESIEQILMDRLQEVIYEYQQSDPYITKGVPVNDAQYVMHFLNFMKDNGTFINCLLNSGMGDLILNAITDYELQKLQCKTDDISLNVKIHLFAGGLYNLYVYWACDEYQTSIQDLTDTIVSFYVG